MARRFESADVRKEQEVPLRASLDGPYRSSTDEEHDWSQDADYENSHYAKSVVSEAGRRSKPASAFRDRGDGRRGFFGQKHRPRRTCTIITVLFVAAIILLLTGSGAWVYKSAPKDGESPSWYPSPLGGTVSSWQESYTKAEALVKSMSLVEKVNITTGVGWMGELCVGNTGRASEAGFPALCLQDGPLGIRFADHSTAFPAGITTGATWNRDLMYQRGRAQGLEARLKGVNVLLGPNMGPLGRMPAGGRNWEGFGPDPVLQAVAAAAVIRGIQDEGVMATAKHYILNEQEHFRQSFEWGLPNAMSSNIDDRTLHELYVWPFAESVRAGVASVMCSYQMVNNSYACGNSKILNGILKDELGFQGFVQSDWLAQRSGVASALAGLDMTMPGDGLRWQDGDSLWGSRLTVAVLNGSVPMSRINDMVTRIVAAWYQLGQDDKEKWPAPEDGGGPNFSSWTDDETGLLHPGTDDNATGVVNKFLNVQGKGKDSHGNLARKIAAEGTVLVKNEGNILPLSRQGKSASSVEKRMSTPRPSSKYNVAIFGEDAGEGRGRNACPDRGCNEGTLASGWGSGAAEFPYLVTPIEALRSAFDPEHVELSEYLTNEPALDGDAAKTLDQQDLCLVFINSDSGEGYISWGGIRGDRNDLFPQKGGDKLVQSVAKSCGGGKGDTIVIVHAVGPVVVERWIDIPSVKGVLLANLPGEESGNALVDILFGDDDASGRLPYTVGKSLEDYGPGGQILYYPNGVVPQQNFTEGLFVDYRHFDKYNINPRYEFGFGLSYTNFTLSNLVVTPLKPKSALPSPRPTGLTPPSYDETIPAPSSALFPPGFRRLKKYVYPYIESTKQVKHSPIYPYPPGYHTPAPLSPAGGGQGGNPSLYDTYAEVQVTLTNTGARTGKQVVQLYLSYPQGVTDSAGSPVDFPVKVLRGFEKLELDPGESSEVKLNLTRKDLSYWCTIQQNWVMPVTGTFVVRVGTSSRDLPLVAEF
ncbi:glycoside hydrolase family 3 protein [Xylona heveae TC161]|uniref:Probable beta-glucosidase E n=1 Tax=Xylona heveae (strain CBS 132557 / TC161) TaxID=1328760 RepID=A0A165FAJ4_XYLHT|nr:glycoside hydrolase family 3 protein [Xylona heveae TC161]KZF20764.1 glycoside hydrolase family 3 protein [Xylona heveae TC161]